MLADGGDCLSDLAALRDQPELFGQVASTATAWWVIERVATDRDGLARLPATRARSRAWAAGAHPELELLVVDADATLVTAHSDAKQGPAGTYQAQLRVPPAAGRPGPRGWPRVSHWPACCGRATPPRRRRSPDRPGRAGPGPAPQVRR
jgi:hypothetical protein